MIKRVFAKKFQERKKIQVLTNAYKKDLSLLYQNSEFPKVKEKIHWTTREIITRKRRIFSYLINQFSQEKTNETKSKVGLHSSNTIIFKSSSVPCCEPPD